MTNESDGRNGAGAHEGARRGMRWAMAAFYAGAGFVHLRYPDGFLAIMPDWVPFPSETVALTGVAEILGAAGLLIPAVRWWAGVMLALYAVCVFPANIKHAFDQVPIAGVTLDWRYHAPRLAAQPLLVWWALFGAGVTNWPWRRAGGAATKSTRSPNSETIV